MSTFNGLPAHVLLVHFVVVLAPMTAVLLVLCAFWPAARQRLVWPTLAMAAGTLILTPLTTDAGEWLEKRVDRSAALHTHTELGDTMIYVSAVLLVVAVAIVAVHRLERTVRPTRLIRAVIAVVALAVAAGSIVQVYRIGESGARASWGDSVTADSASAAR